MPDMHSTGLRVVGAWLFAIVLILFSTVFVHVPYTREIQMVLAIPVLLFFGAPFYAGAWKGTRSGRNNIDRLVALTTSVAFLFSVFNTFFPDYWLGIGLEPHVYYGVAAVIIAFSLTGEFMEERARRNVSAAICRLGGWQHNAARVLPEKQRIDDRVAELFVPVILIISLLTFFIWVFFGGIDVVSHGLFANRPCDTTSMPPKNTHIKKVSREMMRMTGTKSSATRSSMRCFSGSTRAALCCQPPNRQIAADTFRRARSSINSPVREKAMMTAATP